MTYFQFLIVFLGIPLLLFALANWNDFRNGKPLPAYLSNLPAWIPLLIHVFLAVAYTTPWDNYLVATRVWYYNPALVAGITLGWVPIEEYTFFVLQTLLAGLWLFWLACRLPVPAIQIASSNNNRQKAVLAGAVFWAVSAVLLLSGWRPFTYLGLILVWALPPILLQLAFGADILWRNRRLVATTILGMTVYLAAADSLAIGAGTWTIAPEQSLGILLGGILPLEELVFFMVTNTLLVFGMGLALAAESRQRIRALQENLAVRFQRQKGLPKETVISVDYEDGA
jgi:lycopene cyclase domain-containing protein